MGSLGRNFGREEPRPLGRNASISLDLFNQVRLLMQIELAFF